MADQKPRRPDHELYRLLQEEQVEEFNRRRAAGEDFDTRGLDLRALDLRNLDTTGLDFTDCYLKNANLAGLDLREVPMEGASLFEARISGAFFPYELTAAEIRMSRTFGTRLRYCPRTSD